MRNRFFCTYRRDVLHDVLERDRDVISTSAHGGEIIGEQVVPEITYVDLISVWYSLVAHRLLQ